MITKQMAAEARITLGLEDVVLTEENVKQAFRSKSKTAHPDAGGSDAAFANVDRAKCILLEFLKRSPDPIVEYKRENCPNCAGSGRIRIRRGFGVLTIVCGRCKGSGDAQYDVDVQDT